MGRLPPDSTLLTPLPGYEPPSLGPSLQAGPGLGGYEGYQGYDRIYDDDRRPGTGHESLGCATTDGEYET
jgi:transcription factor CON7